MNVNECEIKTPNDRKNGKLIYENMHLSGREISYTILWAIRSFLFRAIFRAHTRPTIEQKKKNNRSMNDDDGCGWDPAQYMNNSQ